MSRHKVLCCDKEWPQQGFCCHDKAWAHNDNALGEHTTRHYTHDQDCYDKPWTRATEEFCHDRESKRKKFYRDRDFSIAISVATDLDSDEKKKTSEI